MTTMTASALQFTPLRYSRSSHPAGLLRLTSSALDEDGCNDDQSLDGALQVRRDVQPVEHAADNAKDNDADDRSPDPPSAALHAGAADDDSGDGVELEAGTAVGAADSVDPRAEHQRHEKHAKTKDHVRDDLDAVRLDGRVARHVLVGADRIHLSLIHISEPTRLGMISYAVF